MDPEGLILTVRPDREEAHSNPTVFDRYDRPSSEFYRCLQSRAQHAAREELEVD